MHVLVLKRDEITSRNKKVLLDVIACIVDFMNICYNIYSIATRSKWSVVANHIGKNFHQNNVTCN